MAPTAHAARTPLPSLLTQLTPTPPFGAPAGGGEQEGGLRRFPIVSAERVHVGIDTRGVPFSVRVRQRLVLLRAGDYSFAIGAPVEDVRAAPGSESEPGLRERAFLWQGFSPGRKVLGADVVLRAAAARPVLPLRISVRRRGATLRIRLANATGVSYPVLTGAARAVDAAATLDEVRRRGRVPNARPITVDLRGRPVARRRVVAAPLRVTGDVTFAAGDAIRVDTLLGDGLPLVHDVVVRRERGAPRLRLEVTPLPPERTLRPPLGTTWRVYVRRRKNVDGRELVSRAAYAQLAWARTRQYQTFLADPDAFGNRSATYRYVTEVRRVAAPQPKSANSGGFPIALVAIPLAVVAAGALVVLWAHS